MVLVLCTNAGLSLGRSGELVDLFERQLCRRVIGPAYSAEENSLLFSSDMDFDSLWDILSLPICLLVTPYATINYGLLGGICLSRALTHAEST